MDKIREERFSRICQALSEAGVDEVMSEGFFESLCIKENESVEDVEFYLYESFGMSSGDIIEALCDI